MFFPMAGNNRYQSVDLATPGQGSAAFFTAMVDNPVHALCPSAQDA